MHHPIDKDGRWKYLVEDAVIKAPSFNGEQLFRISEIEKSDSGVDALAYPIFLDARNEIFLTDVRPTNVSGQQCLNLLLEQNGKYTASSNISRTATAYYEYMNVIEALNGNKENAFVNRWGGEILYDNYKVIINERIGGDYGVEIRYGKNIKTNGLKEEIDMTDVVTRIYPKSFNGHRMSNKGYVDSPMISKYSTIKCTTLTFENIKMRSDLQGEEEVEKGAIICDTQAELDAELTKKCKEQFELGLDKPKITIDADMILLQNTEEYKDYKILESVSLGDTIRCKHNKLGIVTNARVISLEYDCLLDRVTSVKLGDFKKNYFNDVTDNVNKIESVITPEGGLMADKVEGILNAMKTQLKYQKDVAQKQDVRAILFEDLDTESPTYGAMCLGTQGFQISNKRTADGRDWDWKTAGTAHGFNADIVVTGTLTDKTGQNYWNLDTGDFQLVGTGGDQTNWQDKIDQAEQNAIDVSIDAANKALINYANTMKADMNTLQKQVDGQVEDWYYDYEPTPNNVPASNWSTEEDKKKHEGDRFFWKTKGYAYRWMKDGNTWKWVLLQDTDITKALQEAANAKDIADGKRRTFITEPTPPYDVGDLWMNGIDVLTCTNPRFTGGYFYQGDWKKLNQYTDNGYVDNLISDLEKQIDGKIQTYSQATDPSRDWNTTELKKQHAGDIWYDTNNKKTKRWNGNAWQDLTDKDAQDAMQLVQKKAQVFSTTPTIPYYKDDLWFNGKDILTCVTTRTSGYFSSYDWQKKNSYTDDTTAGEALENSKNPNQFLTHQQVFNKLTNNGAIKGIFMRNGQLYINGSYIQADSIGAEQLNVQTLSAISANLGNVISAVITNKKSGNTSIVLDGESVRLYDWANGGQYAGRITSSHVGGTSSAPELDILAENILVMQAPEIVMNGREVLKELTDRVGFPHYGTVIGVYSNESFTVEEDCWAKVQMMSGWSNATLNVNGNGVLVQQVQNTNNYPIKTTTLIPLRSGDRVTMSNASATNEITVTLYGMR